MKRGKLVWIAGLVAGVLAVGAVPSLSSAEEVDPNGVAGEGAPALAPSSPLDALAGGRRCVLMTNPDMPGVEFYIQAWPGGYITGSICGAPDWTVTRVAVNRPAKQAELCAEYTGGSSCAYAYHLTVTKSGSLLAGEYCWDDGTWCYRAEVVPTPCDF
ncbi:MAG: hypothetical protein HY900_02550 [Deltaproteobacteria bacterium]|nr:hypothetical protein [Deltaproteobacteria bacterium]